MLPGDRRADAGVAVRRCPQGRHSRRAPRARLDQDRPRPGPSPPRQGGFGTPDGKVALRADRLTEHGIDPSPFYDPPAEVADAKLARRYPLAMITPKTHLFLNST